MQVTWFEYRRLKAYLDYRGAKSIWRCAVGKYAPRWALYIISLILLFSCSLAFAEQVVEIENKAYWLCKSKKQVRTIRVHVDETGTCTTMYSKENSEKSVGSGKNQESCLNFLNNIKTNLEKSNWTCRDISSARMTAGLE